MKSNSNAASIDVLESVQANLAILHMKTWGFHWNIEGPEFPAIHKLLGDQYESLADRLDSVSERIRQLGSQAPMRFEDFCERSLLDESEPASDCRKIARILLADHEFIIESILKELSGVDPVTNNFLVGLVESHQKDAWMLRAIDRGKD